MRALFIKITTYTLLMLILLEGMVRIFHLHSDAPIRMIDQYKVEKNVPGQMGLNVTGNRKQNAIGYRINKMGFNAFDYIPPQKDAFEIALIGDSFIEGLHQEARNSIGKMIEQQLDTVRVLEFGCSGYDMADQLHLTKAYENELRNVDKFILYLKYENDLNRSIYEPNFGRIQKQNSLYTKLKNSSKLLVYLANLGVLNKFTQHLKSSRNILTGTSSIHTLSTNTELRDEERLSNFKELATTYDFDPEKYVLLLDSRQTSSELLTFCMENGIEFIDLASSFATSDKETTLVYDMHWNTYGRELVAGAIATFISRSQD